MPSSQVDEQLWYKERIHFFIALSELVSGDLVFQSQITHSFLIRDDGVIDLLKVPNARAETNSLSHKSAAVT